LKDLLNLVKGYNVTLAISRRRLRYREEVTETARITFEKWVEKINAKEETGVNESCTFPPEGPSKGDLWVTRRRYSGTTYSTKERVIKRKESGGFRGKKRMKW